MTRYKLVEVHWLDAIDGGTGWTEHGAIPNKPMPSVAVGHLIAKDRDAVTVACLVNEHHTSQSICIPMGMVTRIHYLRRVKR